MLKLMLYTAVRVSKPANIRVSDVDAMMRNRFDELVEQAAFWLRFDTGSFYPQKYLKLLIIDEANRLKLGSLEATRDIYERTNLSILPIGSPGIDRRRLTIARRKSGASKYPMSSTGLDIQRAGSGVESGAGGIYPPPPLALGKGAVPAAPLPAINCCTTCPKAVRLPLASTTFTLGELS